MTAAGTPGGLTPALKALGLSGILDTLDARLAFTKPDSRYAPELGLGVNNLTDVRGVASHQGAVVRGTRYDFYHFVQPRTALLSLSMKY